MLLHCKKNNNVRILTKHNFLGKLKKLLLPTKNITKTQGVCDEQENHP